MLDPDPVDPVAVVIHFPNDFYFSQYFSQCIYNTVAIHFTFFVVIMI